jgi:hypothetical protein
MFADVRYIHTHTTQKSLPSRSSLHVVSLSLSLSCLCVLAQAKEQGPVPYGRFRRRDAQDSRLQQASL